MPHVKESFADMLASEGKSHDSAREYRITTPARLPLRIKEGYAVEVQKVNGSAGEVFTLVSRVHLPPPQPRLSKSQVRTAEAWAKSVPSHKKGVRKGAQK